MKNIIIYIFISISLACSTKNEQVDPFYQQVDLTKIAYTYNNNDNGFYTWTNTISIKPKILIDSINSLNFDFILDKVVIKKDSTIVISQDSIFSAEQIYYSIKDQYTPDKFFVNFAFIPKNKTLKKEFDSLKIKILVDNTKFTEYSALNIFNNIQIYSPTIHFKY